MNYQKAIGIFLAAIMLMSIGTYFFAGPLSNQNGNQNDVSQAPGFDTIPGTKVDHELNSMQDGLSMTPEGVTTAIYVDYSRAYNSDIGLVVPGVSGLYNSSVINRFGAYNPPTNFSYEAHVIQPEVINFDYSYTGETYNGYYLLLRGQTESGPIYNIVGTPMLFGSRDSLEKVTDVISGNLQKSTDFDRVLPYITNNAEYQMVTSNDNLTRIHYIELMQTASGNYTRTEIFVDPQQSLLDNIAVLEANSTERGLVYNVINYDNENITKVVMETNKSNFSNLINEVFFPR
ncbi:MAG: hypothetical protein PWR29_876 [Methanolobus sp.]|nr:hypothetical protein [Methanolobus sp.]MDN5310763.1 hypothetical protein [Methanolobus sp.]